eukprot:3624791-Amphidinium_carterae.1
MGGSEGRCGSGSLYFLISVLQPDICTCDGCMPSASSLYIGTGEILNLGVCLARVNPRPVKCRLATAL